MNQLIPAILAQDENTFLDRLRIVEKEFRLIQIDVMDGAFVPNRTWFDAEFLRELETPAKFELHLMVHDPAFYVDETKEVKHVIRHLWHVEVRANHIALINLCHEYKKEAGLAISPKTPLDALSPYADLVDEILVMGAEPGFSGQILQPETVRRAKEIHKRWPKTPIGFDINVNGETIPLLKAAGVTRFCAASAIFNQTDPLAAAKELKALL